MSNIEHVVVLMLENRSFDSMLGWLYEEGDPVIVPPPAAPGDGFRGLQSIDLSQFINSAKIRNQGFSVQPQRGASGFTVPGVDPGEEFEHVNMQFFGTKTPDPGAMATMTGVLKDYVSVLETLAPSEANFEAAGMIMDTYTPAQLPVLNQLAKHYAVSDDWFASVPSQTNPNRAFLMSGTSYGLVCNGELESNDQAKAIESKVRIKIGDDRFPVPTIFNALEEASADWMVFWQTSYLPQKISTLLELADSIPWWSPNPIVQAIRALVKLLEPYTEYLQELSSGTLSSSYTWRLFPQIRENIKNAEQHFADLRTFFERAEQGTLPNFSYIEPFWTMSQTGVDDGIKRAITALGNDYHPPCNLQVSENFVSEVYTALISNREAWSKTLLIITFDEFVGTFDHVQPPAAVPPWGAGGTPPFQSDSGFKFDRFGARVPAILVSPWVQKGTVFRRTGDVPYDHTSVIKTTLKWLDRDDQLEQFGERTGHAPTFDNVLTLDRPRTDERSLEFLKPARAMGNPVRYGDLFVLRSQNNAYLTVSENAPKLVSILPESLHDLGVDIGLRARFPTFGGSMNAALAFKNTDPDAGVVKNNDEVWLTAIGDDPLGNDNFLGAWADSKDCYYYDSYLQGDHKKQQTWTVSKVDGTDPVVRFGDQVHLVNLYYHTPLSSNGKWITTAANGEHWTIVPFTEIIYRPMPGQADDIGVGGNQVNEQWLVDSAGDAYWFDWTRRPADWSKVSDTPTLVRIAVGPDGLPWAIDKVGQIHRRRGTSAPGDAWEAVGGPPSGLHASDLAIGANGVAWFVNSAGACYSWDDKHSDWLKVSDTPALTRIAVGPDGLPWAIGTSRQIYRRRRSATGDEWETMPGHGTDIGIGSDGTPWTINGDSTARGAWRWDGSEWQFADGVSTNRSIAVSFNGLATVVTSDHRIGRYDLHFHSA